MGNEWLIPWSKRVDLTKPLSCTTETYLSHGDSEGELVSSPTERRLSNTQTAPLLHLLDNSQYPNQMDYFNDYANLYPTSSTHEEFNAYQFLDQVLATEGDNCNVPYSTFADPWGMPEQPMAGSSTNILATDSYGRHHCNLSTD